MIGLINIAQVKSNYNDYTRNLYWPYHTVLQHVSACVLSLTSPNFYINSTCTVSAAKVFKKFYDYVFFVFIILCIFYISVHVHIICHSVYSCI